MQKRKDANEALQTIKNEKMDMLRELNAAKMEFTFAKQQYQVRLDDKQGAIEKLEVENATLAGKNDGDLVVKSCVLCMDAPSEVAFLPCGHFCACEECVNKMLLIGKDIMCPICRVVSHSLPRIYIP